MNNYGFAVRWSDEDAAYIAVCPEFPGLSAFGDTAADALREIQVALELAVETCQEEGWPLPAPQSVPRYSGQFRLRVPRSLHGQLADRAEVEGVSLNTLAVSYLAAGLGEAHPPTPVEQARSRPALREHTTRRRRNVA
jgi:predicted RNase H-like HicB family nuclease